MKKMFLGICYFVISQSLWARQVQGTVTDVSSGAAIASATVELVDVGSTITDNEGKFLFRKIKPGNYSLHISSIGYRTLEKNVSTGDTATRFQLERWNLFLQPVEIKAIRAEEISPFTKTDISKKDIERQNFGQDLPFLLN